MTEKYVIWDFEDVPNALVPKNLLGLDDIEDETKLRMGYPFDQNLPKDLSFTADPDFPDDLLLIDCFANTEGVFPVSESVREFFVEKELANVEYIPVTILDHRARPMAAYWLVHPTLIVDCLDRDQSEFEVSFLDADQIEFVSKLVLDESALPNADIFRIKSLPSVVCISADLAREIDERRFTGFSWEPIDEFML